MPHATTPQRPNHEPWCDRAQHTRITAQLGPTACLGRLLPIGDHSHGWWSRDEGRPPRFHLAVDDRLPWNLSADDLDGLRATLTVGPLRDGLATALAELHGATAAVAA